MPNQIQILRSSTAGSRPAGRQPGEPYVNFANRQFGVFDAGAVDLIAVRYFATTSLYALGDHVIEAGVLYHCTTAVTVAGAFTPANWTAVILAGGPFLPLSAGAGAPLTGALHLPAAAPTLAVQATNKAYVDAADLILQDQIDLLTSNLLFVGTINVVTDAVDFTVASGFPDGVLPAAAAGNANCYLIVSNGGNPPAGNIPPGTYASGDWLVSTGTAWVRLPIGQAAVIASQVAITPVIPNLGANVQTGLTWLEGNKLDLAGGTMTGPLILDADATAGLEAVSFQQLADIIIDAGTYP